MSITSLQAQQLYVAYFGRPADVAGLDYWTNLPSATVASVAASFAGTAEYKADYAGLDAYHIVSKVYQNLFGHAPDPAGLVYWGNLLFAGTLNVSNIVLDVAAGALGSDLTAYNDKVTAAGDFTAALVTSPEILAYSGAAANVVASNFIAGVTSDATLATAIAPAALTATVASLIAAAPVTSFTLTTGVDTFAGTTGNTVFNGILSTSPTSPSTLTSFDNLTGAAGGANALNIIADGSVSAMPAGVTLNNIQTVNLHSTSADQSFSTAGVTGVTALNVTDSGATPTASASVTAAGTTAVTVAGDVLGITSLGLTVNGGSTVTVTAAGSDVAGAGLLGNIAVGTTTAATGAVTVNATETLANAGSAAGNITVAGGTAATVNSTVNDGIALTTATGTVAANAASTITVTGASGAVVVNDATNVTSLTSIITSANAVSVTGGTTVTVNETATAIQTATAGSTVAEGAVSVTGGAATTAVTVNQAATGQAGAVVSGTAEAVLVTWTTMTAVAGTETVGGLTITSDGLAAYTAAQLANVAGGGTVAGLSVSLHPLWSVAPTIVPTTSTTNVFTSTALNTSGAPPVIGAPTGGGAMPTEGVETSVPTSTVTAGGTIAAAATPAITGVNAVAAETAAPGVTGVAGVAAVNGGATVAAAAAVVGAPGVVDAAVTIADATNTSTATSTITSVTLNNYGNSTFTGAALVNLSLAGTGGTLSITNGATTAATNTTLALAVNGLTGGVVSDVHNEITTLNITTGATKSTLAGFTDTGLTTLNVSGSTVLSMTAVPATIATLAVTGAAGFNGDISGTAVTAFAPTSSGVITTTLNDATQTFTGSSGQDIVSIAGDATKAITGGSATTNEVVLTNSVAAAGSASALYTLAHTGTNVTHFTTLGVNDAVATNVNNYDMHGIFTGYNAIDLQSAMTGAQSFAGVAAGTTLALDTSETAVSYLLQIPSSASTVAVSVGSAGASTIGTLTLNDSNGDGVATLNLTNATANTQNIITTLADTSLTNLTIGGAGYVQIGSVTLGQPNQAVPVGVGAITITNNSTAFNSAASSQYGSTIVTLTDDTLGTLNFAGSNATTITTVNDNSAVFLTISNTGADAATITSLITDGSTGDVVHNGLTNLTFTGNSAVNIGSLSYGVNGNTATTETITNSGTATDSITAWTPGTVATLTVLGNVALGAAGTNPPPAGPVGLGTPISFANTTGTTITAGTDNARVNITLAAMGAAADTDSITLGNANNSIVDASTTGIVKVTVGTGSNLIDLHTGSAAAYSAAVALGAHSATTGSDSILVGTVATAGIAPDVTITGAVAGDNIVFKDAATSSVTLTAAQQLVVSGAATLALALADVDALASTIAHSATAFQYNGSTYIVESAGVGNGTLTSSDGFVDLSGLAAAAGIVDSNNAPTSFTLPTGTTSIAGTGTGNETFIATWSDTGGTNTFIAGDIITGNATGTNTLYVNPSIAGNPSTLTDTNFGAGTISHIQNLVFGNTGIGAFTLTTGGNFNSDFTTVNLTAGTTAGALTITASATAGADTFTATSTTGAITMTVGSGTDTILATANGVGAGAVTISAAAGVDNITAFSSGAVSITSTSTTGDTLLSGTSTASAALIITASGVATTGTYNISATDASGTDTINVATGTGAELYKINLGGHIGIATIFVSEIGAGAQSTVTTYAANTVVTGAQTSDIIQTIDGSGTGAVGSLGGEASVNAGVVAAYAAAAAHGFETFTFSGNTYLVETVAGASSAIGSTIVELVGLHTFGVAAAGHVTLVS